MAKVELNKTAPFFSLENFEGIPVTPADFKDKSNLLLIFNRGFM